MLICMILKCFSALVPQSLYLFHDLLCYLATYRCICLSKTILLTCLPIFLARTYLCTCRHIYLCLYIILSVYFSDLSVEYILEKMDGSCQYNLCFMVHKALKSQFLCFFFCQHSIPSSKKKIINTMRIGFSSGSPMKLNFEKVGVALQQDWMDIDHHWYWLNSNIDRSWWINGSPDQYDQCITGSLYICLSMFSHQVEPLDHRFLLQDRSFNGSPFNVSSPLRQLSREAGCFSKMPCYSFGILQNQTASSKFWIWFVYARYSNLLNYIPLSFIVYSI